MEVNPGYKQTAVGIIPNEWDVLPLGSLVKLQGGYSFRSENFSDTGVPVIRISDIQAGIVETTGAIRHPPMKLSDEFIIRDGDFLVAMSGATTGKVGVFRQASAAYQNQRVGRFVVRNKARTSQDFVGHLVRSHSFGSQLSVLLEQGAQPNVSGRQIESLVFPAPLRLHEQLAIAEALSDVDALLAGLDRLIAKKRDLKQAAMQQLLTGQTRLAGFAPSNPRFRTTQVGLFPEDWKLVPLLEVVDPARGIRYGIVQPGQHDPQGRYMIRGQDYSEVKGWAEPSDVFRVSAAIEERYRNARVKTGDLIMTIVGYCGYVEVIPDWLDGANLTQTTARIAIQPSKAASAYCKYLLLSATGRNQVAVYVKGAAQPGLNCGDVEQFLLPLPSIPEQTAIAEVLMDMDTELAALEKRREKTRGLKQAMMQELLTGRTRLV